MPNQTPAGYNRPIPGEPDPWDPSDPEIRGILERRQALERSSR